MRLIIHILLLLIIFSACNMTGYNDLGEPVNRFGQFGENASSFIKTGDPEIEPAIKVFTISDIQEHYGSCSCLFVEVDTQAVRVNLKTGTYEISGSSIHISYLYDYANTYQKKTNPSKHSGAEQKELSAEDVWTWQYNASAGQIKIEGETYQSILPVFEAVLAKTDPNWPEQFIKLYLLSTMSAHCRIEGFGGIGMLQYIHKNTIFNGLLFGNLDFRADGLLEITSQFSYDNHSDLSGLILDGVITNQSNMSGTGQMGGVVSFEVQGSSQIWQGEIDYSSIKITHTLPTAGNYLLTLNGQTCAVDYDFGNPGNFDFTDIANL